MTLMDDLLISQLGAGGKETGAAKPPGHKPNGLIYGRISHKSNRLVYGLSGPAARLEIPEGVRGAQPAQGVQVFLDDGNEGARQDEVEPAVPAGLDGRNAEFEEDAQKQHRGLGEADPTAQEPLTLQQVQGDRPPRRPGGERPSPNQSNPGNQVVLTSGAQLTLVLVLSVP